MLAEKETNNKWLSDAMHLCTGIISSQCFSDCFQHSNFLITFHISGSNPVFKCTLPFIWQYILLLTHKLFGRISDSYYETMTSMACKRVSPLYPITNFLTVLQKWLTCPTAALCDRSRGAWKVALSQLHCWSELQYASRHWMTACNDDCEGLTLPIVMSNM